MIDSPFQMARALLSQRPPAMFDEATVREVRSSLGRPLRAEEAFFLGCAVMQSRLTPMALQVDVANMRVAEDLQQEIADLKTALAHAKVAEDLLLRAWRDKALAPMNHDSLMNEIREYLAPLIAEPLPGS